MRAPTIAPFRSIGLPFHLFIVTLLIVTSCGPNNRFGGGRQGGSTQSQPITVPLSSPTTATSSTTSTGDKIGIPECDDFIAKYEACVSGKVPEAARASYQTALKQWRESWKKLAENPQTKGTLAAACKQAKEQQEAALKSYGCTW